MPQDQQTPPKKKPNIQKIGENKYQYRRFQVPPDSHDIDIPDGDPFRGQKQYQNMCAGCHELDESTSMGPALRYVYMRKAGTGKGFRGYSSLMPISQFYWTKSALDQFLEDPEKMFPDTNMAFWGIKDPYDRACIIEYLHFLRTEVDGASRKPKKNIV